MMASREHAHRSEPFDADGDDVVAGSDHRAGEEVALADEIGDEPGPREAVDLRRLVGLLDAAVVHHRNPVRQRQRFGLVVRHVDERDADFLLQVDELDLQLLAELRVECCQRLVEQQHRRMRDERAREWPTRCFCPPESSCG